MFTVSASAQKALDEFFSANPGVGRCIRVYFAQGPEGPAPALAADRPVAADRTEEIAGVVWCMASHLAAAVGEVAVDLAPGGLVVRTGRAGGQGCGGSCGSCQSPCEDGPEPD